MIKNNSNTTNGSTASINPKDVHIEAYPAPQGGMHVGMPKGVKITHKSGLVVAYDKQRSQHLNRDVVLRALAAALAVMESQGE